jgi:RNA polymerase primary sigma factor
LIQSTGNLRNLRESAVDLFCDKLRTLRAQPLALRIEYDGRVKKRPRPSDDATLDAYLREISRFPPLTREEESELACRIRRHRDERAFKRLVEANLRFVVSYAERYRGLGVVFLDLVDEGNLGLMEAARRFDPERNGKFIAYATWWIRQAFMHALADQGRVFAAPAEAPPPVSPRQTAPSRRLEVVDAAIWREMAELFDLDDLGPEPAGAAPPKGERAAMAEDDGLEFGEALRAERDPVMTDTLVRRAAVLAVREVIHELAPREREVIGMRFGLDEQPMTLEQIGDRLRLSYERVRQIEARARGKLRRSHRARELRSTLN